MKQNQCAVTTKKLSTLEEQTKKIIQDLQISQIICDPCCQQREQLDSQTIADYTEILLAGSILPAVKVMFDGLDYWLYDGFHTLHSAQCANLTVINAEVKQGSLRDAILASVGVNATHGLRRSNQTKRNAVMTLLGDDEWSQWSNLKIAQYCRVSESLVRTIKKNLGIRSDKIVFEDNKGQVREMKKGKLETNGHSTHECFVLNEENKNTNKVRDCSVQQLNELKDITKECSVEQKNKSVTLSSHSPFLPTSNREVDYQIGDLVFIDSNRQDKKLIGHYNSKAIITEVFEHSVNLKMWHKTLENISFNDIKKVTGKVTVFALIEPNKLKELMLRYSSLEEFIDLYITKPQLHESTAI